MTSLILSVSFIVTHVIMSAQLQLISDLGGSQFLSLSSAVAILNESESEVRFQGAYWSGSGHNGCGVTLVWTNMMPGSYCSKRSFWSGTLSPNSC